MKNFEVITKENCPKCSALKDWFKRKKIDFEELPIEAKWVADKLLGDKKFIQHFCDIDGCTVYTPLIHMKDTGEYVFKELFGINGLREEYITRLLEL